MAHILTVETIPHDRLTPNPWNPNRMDEEMFAKERASIRAFGFVDPLTVRDIRDGDMFEIIDGEHRWKAGYAEGVDIFPCIVLDVTEDEAKELTIILNDTRGTMQEDRLSDLVKDLAERRESSRMATLLPYDRSRMEQLLERREIDWSELEARREKMQQPQKGDSERWVERVFRLPAEAAGVIDRAIERVQDEEGIDQDWRALEMIAADYLGG
jgi:ParB-like chromosome segregation protein Spo0J